MINKSNIIKTTAKLMTLALLPCTLPAAAPAQGEPPAEPAAVWEPDRPWEVIDVAIALDTSGSMQNLIDTARVKLWEIVNDLERAEPAPTLRVALLSYGNQKGDSGTGWTRLESDLTEDLDRVSERLFALTSEGGTEYVGRVLQVALEGLSWTESQDALKLIFVAGNESADQDPEVSFRNMSDLARREGIFVQAVFCGGAQKPDAESWKEMAELATGGFAAIDHRSRVAVTESPFDEELVAASAALNETYLPLGEEGRERLENRAAQDRNAQKASPATAAARALTKSSASGASWDLVAAVEENEALLYEIDESELPESMRAMSFEERERHVEEMRLVRAELRERIAELGARRQEFVAEQTAQRGGNTADSFDAVMRRTIREKAEEKGFRFPER